MADPKSRSIPPKSRSVPPRPGASQRPPAKPAPRADATRGPRPISPRYGVPKGRLRKIDPAAGSAPAAKPDDAAPAKAPPKARSIPPKARSTPPKARSTPPRSASIPPTEIVFPKSAAALAPISRSIFPMSTPDEAPELPTVLVVEDDDDARRLIVRALGQLFTVYDACDGEEALRVLERLPPVACVVTDIMMPKVDGIMLAKKMRADSRLRAVPVVFVTGRGNIAGSALDGINVGARFTLQKPFKVKELVEKIREVVLTTAGSAKR